MLLPFTSSKVPDSICVGTKIKSDRASVHTYQEGDFGAISVMESSCTARICEKWRVTHRIATTVGAERKSLQYSVNMIAFWPFSLPSSHSNF